MTVILGLEAFHNTGRQILALAIGTVCGWVAYLIGMPLAWMLGSMIGLTVASMGGLPVHAPNRLRPIVIPVIGVMLGSAITPEVLRGALQWLPTMLILPVFLAVAAGVSYQMYRRLGGYDPVTAYFSSMPGGLNEMLLLGIEKGGDPRKIALAHAVRILMVILCVALFFGLVMGVSARSGAGRPWVGLTALDWVDAGWLIGAAAVGAPLGKWLRLPAGNMLGPMLLSSIVHALHLVDLPPPSLLINGAQVVLGTVIGCRFLGSRFAEVRRDMVLGTLSATLMIAVAVVFAWVVWVMTGTPITQAFLAYSPGGLTEMSLLALAMGQDIAYVSVTHIVRIMIVIMSAPIAQKIQSRH